MNRVEKRALALLLWLPVLGWLVVTTAVTATPQSALDPAVERVAVDDLHQLLPQGWAFFTRDPREPQVAAYTHVDGNWSRVTYPPTNSTRWLLGLHRGARLSAAEIAVISAGVPASAWAECGRGDHVLCLQSLKPVPELTIGNEARRPALCGTVGFVRQEPVPWAWNASAESVRMPLTGVVVETVCEPR